MTRTRITQRPIIRLPIIYVTMTDTHSLETPYISIYDIKPTRRKPKQSEEERIQKHRENSAKYYNENYEYCLLQKRIQSKIRYDAKKATKI